MMTSAVAGRREAMVLVALVALLAGGAAATWWGATAAGGALWLVAALGGLVVVAGATVEGLRHGRPGVDAIAFLALVGALAVGEHAAAAVVAVMLATGQVLEARAAGRAERELRALLARAPVMAHRRAPDGTLAEVAVAEIRPGDVLAVRAGEVFPVDARVVEGPASVDESAVTGEALPVTVEVHGLVTSGATNVGGPVLVQAVATAAASTYAGIVALVERARAEPAPFVRLADRYALGFVPATVALAALAWAVSGTFERAVAVLVVATPCPLILAAPVAIVAGLSQAARRGVIVKDGGALERLGRARVLVFDKTGTVTTGRPEVVDVVPAPGVAPTAVLRAAASVEQVSGHVLASAVVDEAAAGGIGLSWPEGPREHVGRGLTGVVDGVAVRAGRLDWLRPGRGDEELAPWAASVRRRTLTDAVMTVFVELDGELAGAVVLHDPTRPDATRTLRELRSLGFRRLVMASGDRAAAAEAVGAAIGADAVLAECTPRAKVEAVRSERAAGVTVMAGDGINDAPALAAADVGVALGARGASASSEAADVVITVDRIDRLLDGVVIARRSRRIAGQSVVAGMSLAGVAMVVAAAGQLPPLAGAVVQEAIDVVAILNALRAALAGRSRRPRLQGAAASLGRRFEREHRSLAGGLRLLRAVADDLDRVPLDQTRRDLDAVVAFLREDLVPHELAEDRQLYPAVARVLGGVDPTAPMSRAHVEIARQVGVVERLVSSLDSGAQAEPTLRELRRVLYGLDAIVRLHAAQEEQEYLSLADEAGPPSGVQRRADGLADQHRHR